MSDQQSDALRAVLMAIAIMLTIGGIVYSFIKDFSDLKAAHNAMHEMVFEKLDCDCKTKH